MDKSSNLTVDEEVALLRDRVRRLEQQLSQHAADSAIADHSEVSQRAFDSATDAIMVFDAETKQFVDANEAVTQLYGYTREEFLALNHADITAEPEESRRSFQQLLAGKLSRVPVRYHKKKDGTVFPVEISASRFDNAGRTLFCGTIRDISDRMQAEERADAILSAVIEGTASATGEKFFPAFARALASVLGSRYILVCEHVDTPATRAQTRAFWMGDRLGDSIEYDLADGPCEETALGKMTFYPHGVQALFPKDKGLVDLDAESYFGIPLTGRGNQLIGHLAILDDRPMSADICDVPTLQVFVARAAAELERARVEQESRDSEQRLRLVTDSLPAFISYLDMDRRYQFVNRHYQEQFGIKQEDIVGKHPREILGEEYYQGIIHHLDAAFAGNRVKYESTMQIEGKGSCTLVTQHIPDATPHGDVRGVFNLVTDISDLKDAEEEARKRHEELAHLSRINTMGEMAAALAHELNQPLAAVATYSFAMEESLKSDREVAHNAQRTSALAEKIKSQAIRAGDIVRRMRTFLRNRDSIKTPADLNHIVREAVALVEPEGRDRSIEFQLMLPNDLPNILLDDVRIEQVLVNLIRNAFDSMSETDVDERIVQITTSLNAGQFVEVAVQDFGRGIRSDDVDLIFDAFFTTKRAGMGMGLAISQSIIEEHNGRLWCDPNVSQGAIFRFTIPTSLAESERGSSDASGENHFHH